MSDNYDWNKAILEAFWAGLWDHYSLTRRKGVWVVMRDKPLDPGHVFTSHPNGPQAIRTAISHFKKDQAEQEKGST